MNQPSVVLLRRAVLQVPQEKIPGCTLAGFVYGFLVSVPVYTRSKILRLRLKIVKSRYSGNTQVPVGYLMIILTPKFISLSWS